jgi:hypothetical protein
MFVEWQEGIQAERGVSLAKRQVCDELQSAVRQLLPLTSVERRRYLFIPTRSNWTAFLDNGHQGTDVFSTLSFLAEKLHCNAMRATYVPEGRRKQFPAAIFELYGPDRTDFLNYTRSVAVSYDGAKWAFSSSGEVQSFEHVVRHSSQKIRDRFTPEMLLEYTKALSVRMYDEDYYAADGECAYLVEKSGPIAASAREFQLADLR